MFSFCFARMSWVKCTPKIILTECLIFILFTAVSCPVHARLPSSKRSVFSVVTRMDTPKSGTARRLELNRIIFRQIAPTVHLHDLVAFKEISIQRLKKAKMRMVTPKYGSKPT